MTPSHSPTANTRSSDIDHGEVRAVEPTSTYSVFVADGAPIALFSFQENAETKGRKEGHERQEYYCTLLSVDVQSRETTCCVQSIPHTKPSRGNTHTTALLKKAPHCSLRANRGNSSSDTKVHTMLKREYTQQQGLATSIIKFMVFGMFSKPSQAFLDRLIEQELIPVSCHRQKIRPVAPKILLT